MFKEIDIKTMPLKVFEMLDKNWMLITAGDLKSHNTMTASWGGFGILWHNPVATIYVRPQRYTKEFLDREKFFSLSFYDEKYKKALDICGSKSGRDINKDIDTGLTPKVFENTVAYSQANMVIVCEKQYVSQIDYNNILNKDILDLFYKQKDYSYIYIGKILKTYICE